MPIARYAKACQARATTNASAKPNIHFIVAIELSILLNLPLVRASNAAILSPIRASKPAIAMSRSAFVTS